MIAALLIRDASPLDLAEIIAIEQRVFPHPWTAGQLAFELNRQPVALNLVAVSDSRLMGYLMAHVIADVVNLNNLAVDLPVQHRGIGQRLMRSFLERLNGFNI
ncbi:MAG: GNAT family N-acetyltransferase, partial [Candidatus Neomarinimicrobiota bacterium]